jgi:hypothetical protein
VIYGHRWELKWINKFDNIKKKHLIDSICLHQLTIILYCFDCFRFNRILTSVDYFLLVNI